MMSSKLHSIDTIVSDKANATPNKVVKERRSECESDLYRLQGAVIRPHFLSPICLLQHQFFRLYIDESFVLRKTTQLTYNLTSYDQIKSLLKVKSIITNNLLLRINHAFF